MIAATCLLLWVKGRKCLSYPEWREGMGLTLLLRSGYIGERAGAQSMNTKGMMIQWELNGTAMST
eukprot:1310004-Ditylum_brightwellii.AAC.1